MTMIATVPSGHSYGYETTIAPQLFGGAATEASLPLFPADVRAVLAKTPARCLVTTPVHLRALVFRRRNSRRSISSCARRRPPTRSDSMNFLDQQAWHTAERFLPVNQSLGH